VSTNPKVIDLMERAYQRPVLREAVRESLVHPLDRVDCLTDMLECGTVKPYAFLLMDFEAYDKAPRKVFAAGGSDTRQTVMESFFSLNPKTVSIMLSPDSRGVMSTLDATLAVRAQKVVPYEMLKDDTTFHDIFRRFRHTTLAFRVRDGYWQQVLRTEREILARPYVEIILQMAPHHKDVCELVEGTVARGDILTVKGLSRALKTQDQLSAKTLLMMFRALWYTKLVNQGWTKKRIAAYLQYPSSREMRKTLGRQSVSLDDMEHVTFEEALAWAADNTTRPYLGNPPHISELLPKLIHGSYRQL
jgi:hypothetical protein